MHKRKYVLPIPGPFFTSLLINRKVRKSVIFNTGCLLGTLVSHTLQLQPVGRMAPPMARTLPHLSSLLFVLLIIVMVFVGVVVVVGVLVVIGVMVVVVELVVRVRVVVGVKWLV